MAINLLGDKVDIYPVASYDLTNAAEYVDGYSASIIDSIHAVYAGGGSSGHGVINNVTSYTSTSREGHENEHVLLCAFYDKYGRVMHFALDNRNVTYTGSYYTRYKTTFYTYIKDSLVLPDFVDEADKNIIRDNADITYGIGLVTMVTPDKKQLHVATIAQSTTGKYYLMSALSVETEYFYVYEPFTPPTPPPPPGGKGYYKGVPDGFLNIPEIIPRGVNFLETIYLYDETKQKVNAAFLTNKVGEESYNGVRFSYPNVIVRMKTNYQFTHAVTASWSDDNRPVVYKVVSYQNLGGDLNEYTLTPDGLKTFWQHNNINNANSIVSRSTNPANWNKWVKDSVMYNGTYKYMKLPGTTVSYYICMVINGRAVAVSFEHFEQICQWFLGLDDQEKLLNQISNIFVIPYTADNDCYKPATIVQMKGADETPYSFLPEFNLEQFGTVTVEIEGSGGLRVIEDQSFIYDSNATIHMPCYGDFNSPLDFIYNLTTGPQTCKYRISFLDGTICVSTFPYIFWSPVVGLPQKSMPFDSSKSSIYQINRNQQAGIANIITSGVANAVGGVLSGGGLASLANGVISTAASIVTTKNSADAQRDIVNNSQGIHTVRSTGGASMADNQASIAFLIPNLSMSYPEYYSLVGYPVHKPLDKCLVNSGDTIWLEFNVAALGDKREIIEDLVRASTEGIYWNA